MFIVSHCMSLIPNQIWLWLTEESPDTENKTKNEKINVQKMENNLRVSANATDASKPIKIRTE